MNPSSHYTGFWLVRNVSQELGSVALTCWHHYGYHHQVTLETFIHWATEPISLYQGELFAFIVRWESICCLLISWVVYHPAESVVIPGTCAQNIFWVWKLCPDAGSPNLHLIWSEPYVITIRARVFQKQIFFGSKQGLLLFKKNRPSLLKQKPVPKNWFGKLAFWAILVTWLQSSNYIPVLVTCAPVSVNYRYQGAHNTGALSAKTPLNVETGNDLFCKHSWLAPRLLAIWEASVQPGPATLHIGQ